MDSYISRALQVVDLYDDELSKVHSIENGKNHYLANYEIQALFVKKLLKDVYSFPSDETESSRHISTVKHILDSKKLFIVDSEDIDENGQTIIISKFVNFLSMPEIHAYDKNVRRSLNAKDFICTGSGSNKNGRLKKLVEASVYD